MQLSKYNGLNYRTGWHYDANINSAVNSGDPWYYFCSDERWRIVATFRASDTSPKERFVWHAAGMNGFGNSSYIDTLCRRDRDSTAAWTAAAGTIDDEHLYFCQNWRADVVAVMSDIGTIKEWVKYSAYGVPTRIDPADYNRDGFVSGDDWDQFTDDFTAGNPAADVNFDGFVTGDDSDAYYAAFTLAELEGPGVLSAPSIANRVGYAGYQHAPELAGTKWHVRHRMLDSERGTWTRRDPIRQADKFNRYRYTRSNCIASVDPQGLVSAFCGSGCGGSMSGPPIDDFRTPEELLTSDDGTDEFFDQSKWYVYNILLDWTIIIPFRGNPCASIEAQRVAVKYGLKAAQAAITCRDDALNAVQNIPDEKIKNAMRHCMVAQCLRSFMNDIQARDILEFHELCTEYYFPNTPADDSAIDRLNNNVGRRCASTNDPEECCANNSILYQLAIF